jgi:hypothetical protein
MVQGRRTGVHHCRRSLPFMNVVFVAHAFYMYQQHMQTHVRLTLLNIQVSECAKT